MSKRNDLEQSFEVSLIKDEQSGAIVSILFPVEFIEMDARSRTKVLNQIQAALYEDVTLKKLTAAGKANGTIN